MPPARTRAPVDDTKPDAKGANGSGNGATGNGNGSKAKKSTLNTTSSAGGTGTAVTGAGAGVAARNESASVASGMTASAIAGGVSGGGVGGGVPSGPAVNFLQTPLAIALQNLTSHKQLNWTTFPHSFLESYRHQHNLDVPSSFSSTLNAAVLTAPGFGRHSPTMAKQREKRKIPKESLTALLRRHFNNAAIDEKEVVGDFVYVVKCRDQKFRRRFKAASKR